MAVSPGATAFTWQPYESTWSSACGFGLGNLGEVFPDRLDLVVRKRLEHVGGLVLASLVRACAIEGLRGIEPRQMPDGGRRRDGVVVAHRGLAGDGEGTPATHLLRKLREPGRIRPGILGHQHNLARRACVRCSRAKSPEKSLPGSLFAAKNSP